MAVTQNQEVRVRQYLTGPLVGKRHLSGVKQRSRAGINSNVDLFAVEPATEESIVGSRMLVQCESRRHYKVLMILGPDDVVVEQEA